MVIHSVIAALLKGFLVVQLSIMDRQHCSTEHITVLKLLCIAWTPQPERNSFVSMVHFAIHRLWNVYVQMDMGGSIASFDRIRYHIFIVAGNKKILYLRT